MTLRPARSLFTRGPDRDASLLYTARGVRDSARVLMAVLIAIFLDAIGLSTAQIGVILGLSMAGEFTLSLLVMLSGERLSRRQWSVLLPLVTGAAGLLLIFSDNVYLLGLGAFFGSYAASGSHVGPIIQLEQAGLAQVVPTRSRTSAFSKLSIFSSGGRIVGAALVGIATFLINVAGFELVDAYRVTFGIYIGLNVSASLLYAALSPAIESSAEQSRNWRNPFRTRSRGRIIGISALFGLDSLAGGMVFDSFVAFWLFTKFGVNEGTISGVLLAAQVLNLASLWLAPRVASRFGLLNTFVWTQVASNVFLIAFAVAPGAVLASAFWIVRGIFNEMDVPTRQSYAMAIVHPDERVVMAGTNNLGRAIGRVPSSTLTGVLWSGALNVAPWLFGAGLKLVYDAVVYYSFRKIKPPEEMPADPGGGAAVQAGAGDD